MKRIALPCLVTIVALGLAPGAQASDASLQHALKAYQARLTSDIGYLAGFTVPSRSAAGRALTRLAGVHRDLAAASGAASSQQASSSSGRRGRSLVLAALSGAITATGDAEAAASAARAGRSSAARSDVAAEQAAINRAIPQFEQGGRLLHLF